MVSTKQLKTTGAIEFSDSTSVGAVINCCINDINPDTTGDTVSNIGTTYDTTVPKNGITGTVIGLTDIRIKM
jgi:hypothetical protein